MHARDEISSWGSAWARDELIRLMSADSCHGFGEGATHILRHLETIASPEQGVDRYQARRHSVLAAFRLLKARARAHSGF